ncbi:MAG: 2-oxo acid dehydrogenase subunit E2 [Oscillospiraceae bacterium]|jgi:hypothetical protein|nr:2-oxo acid dehydrogenase subunit E2 [Oscillospiraceae bacterium]
MGNGRKKRFGDRRDGRRLRTIDPYIAMMPYIMKTKNDANNYFKDSVEISEAERFLRLKRLHGYPGMGLLHLFIAAYIRVIAQYPALNRFVAGQRLYARHDIEFVMSVKKELKAKAEETSIKVVFDRRDTISDVYTKLNAEIYKAKYENTATETDDVAKAFMKMPRLILKFAVFFLGTLDYFGRLPKSLVSVSPFHGSIVITDLGSIGLPAIYHHLYNFGNIPIFIAFGAKRKVYVPRKDGQIDARKVLDYTLVLDERICDGFYFSQIFKTFNSILRKPQVLDSPPESVVEDVD